MRISAFACGLAAALVAVCAAVPVVAADHSNVLAESARTVEGGRSVQVLVAQEEIKSDINPSMVVVATGGGLLGALIDAGINAERAKRGETQVQPIRAALTGVNADDMAKDTTKAALAKLPWMQVASSDFGRDNTVVGKGAVLDKATGAQVAFFEYVYDFAPDFSTLRVMTTMTFANKVAPAGKKPTARLEPRNLAYAQSVLSVVSLPTPSKDGGENAARWAANDGKLARKGLAAGFAEVGELIPRALQLTDADVTAMNARDHKFVTLGGRSGRLAEEGPGGTLLFNGSLAHVQTLAD